MEINLDQIEKLLEIIANAPAAATLSAIGFILLIVGVVTALHVLRSDPENTPTWLKFGLFGCLIGGVLFSSAGPGFALLNYQKFPISRVSTKAAFDHLRTNERAYWLVRLISFNPVQHPEFAISKLKQLGPTDQQFTFVASYDELVGYNVDEAVRMIGNTYSEEQHVSAVIFPVAEHQIYPANSRGVLQVIQNIESAANNKISKPLLVGTSSLKEPEIADLARSNALNYWKWDNYKDKFAHYCELTEEFRCNVSYSARNYLGAIGMDWHPLGFAQKNAEEDSCSEPAATYCGISDWHAAENALSDHFGARIFLIENLKIDEIPNRVLIDFTNPPNQFIPDLGFRPTAH